MATTKNVARSNASERKSPTSTLRSIKAAEPFRPDGEPIDSVPAPRYSPEQARRELQDIVKTLYKLNDNIIESHTSSCAGSAADAFGDALQAVLGLRVVLRDIADGLVAEPAAEVRS